MAGAARKCRGVLALSSPLSRCADGCIACKPRLLCDAWRPDAPLLLRSVTRLASKSHHNDSLSNGHIHDCWLCGSYRVSSPSSVVLTRHPKTTSCQHKLVTTHLFFCQLSVPAHHPKLLPAPKSLTSAQEVINEL